MENTNTIPEMTNPLGKSWDQPSKDNILIDDTHAIMSEYDLKELFEYYLQTPLSYPNFQHNEYLHHLNKH